MPLNYAIGRPLDFRYIPLKQQNFALYITNEMGDSLANVAKFLFRLTDLAWLA